MNKKNILFRFDFSRKKNLSYGHYYRSKKIIKLIKNKYNIYFLIKKCEKNFIFKTLKKKNLIQKNCNLYTNNKILKKRFDFCFVDLPYKDKDLHLLKKIIRCFIVIDDKFKNFAISNYYFFNRSLTRNFLKLEKKKIFMGPNYLFSTKYKIKKKPKKEIVNILINFGGSDPLDFTRKILKIISDKKFLIYKFFIILGPGNNTKINFKTMDNIYLFKNISEKKLQFLRQKSDLSISSGGNFLVENIFAGLPTLSISTSYHEKNFIKELMNKYNVTKKISLRHINNLLSQKFFNINVNEIYKNCLKLRNKNKFYETIKKLLNINNSNRI